MARLLHLSDTHLRIGPGDPEAPPVDPAERLARVLDQARQHGPFDAVVITGDVADDGSPAGVAMVREQVRPLAPLHLAVPGNHDETDAVDGVFGPARAQLGDWRVVGAATNVAGQISGDAAPILAALDELDGDDPTAPAVLLTHHPLRSRSTHPWFVLAGGDALEQRLAARSAPLLVLSGHTHETFEDRVGSAYLLGAPSTYYALAHSGTEFAPTPGGTGARVIDLLDGGEHRSFVVSA